MNDERIALQGREIYAQMLDLLSIGVLLVKARRQIVLQNRTAGEILSFGDGLSRRGEELRAVVAAEDERLDHVLTAAASVRNGHFVSFLRIARANGAEPYELGVVAVNPQETDGGLQEVPVLICIAELGLRLAATESLLVRRFRLSPSECKVVLGIARGETLASIARDLFISHHTARTHLRNAFAKTGTRRQVDLMRLVTLGLGGLFLLPDGGNTPNG